MRVSTLLIIAKIFEQEYNNMGYEQVADHKGIEQTGSENGDSLFKQHLPPHSPYYENHGKDQESGNQQNNPGSFYGFQDLFKGEFTEDNIQQKNTDDHA